VLTTISFNYEWRKIVASALQFYFRHGDSSLALDNEDLFNNLILDLYTAEGIGVGVVNKVLNIDLGSNKTTTSAAFVLLAGSDFPYVPSKSNILVNVSNLQIVHSSAGSVQAEVRVNGNSGDFVAYARMSGSTGRPMRASSVFSGLVAGVPITISTYWKTSAPTATASDNNWLVYEIQEWD
jgi:hypothetical protein